MRRFQTQKAQKPYPLGRHIPGAYIREYPREKISHDTEEIMVKIYLFEKLHDF